jgi:hypothetical protein
MKKLLPLALLTLLGATAHAQILITENPNEADASVLNDGSGNLSVTGVNDYQSRIGEYYAPGGSDYVMPFVLPTLAAGQVITQASLQTQLFMLNGTPANADLYALGTLAAPVVTAAAAVQPGYYYQGPADVANTLIQAGYLTAASPVRTDPNNGPFITTSVPADAALVAFLNAAEGVNGANAGDYVYLRVSYDALTIPGGNNAYSLLTDDAGGANEKPILSLTTGAAPLAAPEPSTYVLMAGGLAVLLFQLRRRAQI